VLRARDVSGDVTHRAETEVDECRTSTSSDHSGDVFIDDDLADDFTSPHETAAGELGQVIL